MCGVLETTVLVGCAFRFDKQLIDEEWSQDHSWDHLLPGNT